MRQTRGESFVYKIYFHTHTLANAVELTSAWPVRDHEGLFYARFALSHVAQCIKYS